LTNATGYDKRNNREPVAALSLRKNIKLIIKYETELGVRFFDGLLRDY